MYELQHMKEISFKKINKTSQSFFAQRERESQVQVTLGVTLNSVTSPITYY